MPFENRIEAGELLGRRLAAYRGQHPLVLAIPRGAVPMGKVVADALEGERDVVLVRKLRAPQNPELAIGSVDEVGAVYLDPDLRDLWTDAYLEGETQRQLHTLRQRREAYGHVGPPVDAGGRVVIVLDDGIATGSSMIAALRVPLDAMEQFLKRLHTAIVGLRPGVRGVRVGLIRSRVRRRPAGKHSHCLSSQPAASDSATTASPRPRARTGECRDRRNGGRRSP